MLKKLTQSLGCLLLAAVLLIACSKKENQNASPSHESSANETNPFRTLLTLQQSPAGETRQILNGSPNNISAINGNSSIASNSPCNFFQVTKTSVFDEQILLDPLSDLMYLGSVIDVNSLTDGTYQPVTPITTSDINISLNLLGVQGTVAATIHPQLSTYRQTLNNILNQTITGEQAGELTFAVNQIHSEDQLKQAIGGGFNLGKLADIKANYNFNSTDDKTRIVAKFVQKYFTADMDIPQSGSFVTSLPGSITYSPVYVSSLTYGRMGLFFFESSASSSQVSAAINTTINFVFGKSTLEASTEQKAIFNTSTIKVYTTGGSGTESVQSIVGYQGFVNFILTGGRFNANSRGSILGYKLRALSTNAVYSVSLTSTYSVRDCANIKVPVYSLYHSGIKDHVYSPDPNAQSQWPGWVNHGAAFKAYTSQVEGSVPVYAWYANSITDHVYSTSPDVMYQWAGWINYGPAFYVYTSQVEGTVPVYQWYADSIKDHIYSTDPNAMSGYNGWVNHGVVFYTFPN